MRTIKQQIHFNNPEMPFFFDRSKFHYETNMVSEKITEPLSLIAQETLELSLLLNNRSLFAMWDSKIWNTVLSGFRISINNPLRIFVVLPLFLTTSIIPSKIHKNADPTFSYANRTKTELRNAIQNNTAATQ